MWILSLVRINILWLYNMLFKMYKICIWLNELKYTWTQKHYFKLNHFSSWSNMCRYVQHLYLADSPLILKQIGHFKLAKNFMTSLSTDCSQDELFLANFSCIFLHFSADQSIVQIFCVAWPWQNNGRPLCVLLLLQPEITLHNWVQCKIGAS